MQDFLWINCIVSAGGSLNYHLFFFCVDQRWHKSMISLKGFPFLSWCLSWCHRTHEKEPCAKHGLSFRWMPRSWESPKIPKSPKSQRVVIYFVTFWGGSKRPQFCFLGVGARSEVSRVLWKCRILESNLRGRCFRNWWAIFWWPQFQIGWRSLGMQVFSPSCCCSDWLGSHVRLQDSKSPGIHSINKGFPNSMIIVGKILGSFCWFLGLQLM